MIKAITCIRRKPGMEVEAFQEYWRGPHAEIVTRLPNIKRYVQSHALLGGYRKGDLIYDGIAEIWVDSVDALREMSAGPAYDAVQADEENFIDRTTMALLLTEEHVIKAEPIPEDPVKMVEFIKRKQGMEVGEFQRYWRDVHGPIAAEIPVMPHYIQSHLLLGAYRDGKQPAWDGCAVTWFASVDAMRESLKYEAYQNNVDDVPNFIDDMHFIITKEHFIV